jgi:hypothetical protein
VLSPFRLNQNSSHLSHDFGLRIMAYNNTKISIYSQLYKTLIISVDYVKVA